MTDVSVVLESVTPWEKIPRFSRGADHGTDMYILVNDTEDGRQLVYAPRHSFTSGYGERSYAPAQIFMREWDRDHGFWVVKGSLPGRLSEKTFRDNAHVIDAFFGIPELASMVEPEATVTITTTEPSTKGMKVKRRNNPRMSQREFKEILTQAQKERIAMTLGYEDAAEMEEDQQRLQDEHRRKVRAERKAKLAERRLRQHNPAPAPQGDLVRRLKF